MTFEETVRSALRWHGSFVADAQITKTVLHDLPGYNKIVLESEESSLKQIMNAYRKASSPQTKEKGNRIV